MRVVHLSRRRYKWSQDKRGGSAVSLQTRATIEDLYKVEGKAELVQGEIVHMPRAGEDPSIAGGEIFAHLRD